MPLVEHTVQALREGDVHGRQLSNIAYGAAHGDMGQQMGALFMALAKVAARRMGEFNAQALANTAWAFATVGPPDSQLYTAAAGVAAQRTGDFNH